MAIADLKLDYRTNREIIERIALNSKEWTNAEGQYIFIDDKLFVGISPDKGQSCYQIRVSTKKDKIEPNDKLPKENFKLEYLTAINSILKLIFREVAWYDGGLLIKDANKDYVVSLIKKKKYNWKDK